MSVLGKKHADDLTLALKWRTGSYLSLFLLLQLLLLLKFVGAFERIEGVVGRGGADVDEVGVAGGGCGVGSALHRVEARALDARLLRLRGAKLNFLEFVHRRSELFHQSARRRGV